MFEAVGAYTSGHIDEKELHSFECTACPTCGSCSGMFTANSMNCLLEALGMALPGNGTIPMVYSARLALAKQAGEAVMGLIDKNVCPRDILTPTAVKNAERVDMAIGASSNSVLHLLALASELGFTKEQLSIDTMNEISKTTPNLCRLAPAGEYYIRRAQRSRRHLRRHPLPHRGGALRRRSTHLLAYDAGGAHEGRPRPRRGDHPPRFQPQFELRRARHPEGQPRPRGQRRQEERRRPQDVPPFGSRARV